MPCQPNSSHHCYHCQQCKQLSAQPNWEEILERERAKNLKSAICKIGVVAIGTRKLPINCWGDSDYKEKSQDAIVRTMKSEIALTV